MINTSTQHQLSEIRHAAALDTFISATAADTAEASAYAAAVSELQWRIVAQGQYAMDDAFVLAVEQKTAAT